MSRGIEQRLLAIFKDRPGPLTTFELTATVHVVPPGADGDLSLNDAQVASVRRALTALAQTGAICGRCCSDRWQRWATPATWCAVDEASERLRGSPSGGHLA